MTSVPFYYDLELGHTAPFFFNGVYEAWFMQQWDKIQVENDLVLSTLWLGICINCIVCIILNFCNLLYVACNLYNSCTLKYLVIQTENDVVLSAMPEPAYHSHCSHDCEFMLTIHVFFPAHFHRYHTITPTSLVLMIWKTRILIPLRTIAV